MLKYIFTLVCKQTYKIIWYLAWATMAVDCSGSNTVSTIHSHVRCLGIRSYLMGSVYELWDAIWTTNKWSSSGSSHKIWTTSTQATLYWNNARKRTGNLWVIRIKYKYQVNDKAIGQSTISKNTGSIQYDAAVLEWAFIWKTKFWNTTNGLGWIRTNVSNSQCIYVQNCFTLDKRYKHFIS